MFWSDPNLYTATLPYKEFGTFPYKEFPMQTPFVGQTFTPWQQIPKFIPPNYGMLPYYYDPKMFFNPFLTQGFTPPFVQPFMHQGINPFVQQPFNFNVPLYNWNRPFTY